MSVLMNLAQNNSRKSLQQAADAEMKALEESIQAEIRALEVLMPRLDSFVFRSAARPSPLHGAQRWIFPTLWPTALPPALPSNTVTT